MQLHYALLQALRPGRQGLGSGVNEENQIRIFKIPDTRKNLFLNCFKNFPDCLESKNVNHIFAAQINLYF
jgi:hypothetical protein